MANWNRFLVRYAVRNWGRGKELYDTVGLNAVAATIITLKHMAGMQPATLPDPDVSPNDPSYTLKKIRDGKYSMRELARMIYDLGMYEPPPRVKPAARSARD
jgi:hypothetical protein